jgi:hypothetical protein
MEIAHQIILKYTMAMDDPIQQDVTPQNILDPEESEEPEESDTESKSEGEAGKPVNSVPLIADSTLPTHHEDDRTHQNIRLLIHDLLYTTKLVHAVSDGDWGRIEDILGQLVMMFCGASANNYSTELLHFLHNLKLVWPKDFV